jgi:hypothetical protein
VLKKLKEKVLSSKFVKNFISALTNFNAFIFRSVPGNRIARDEPRDVDSGPNTPILNGIFRQNLK